MAVMDLYTIVSTEPQIRERLDAGQKFNLYDIGRREGERYVICIGPITDQPLSLAETHDETAGNLIVEALRVAFADYPRPQPISRRTRSA